MIDPEVLGSPLMRTNTTEQVGIFSHGVSECNTTIPYVYTAVAPYNEWIETQLNFWNATDSPTITPTEMPTDMPTTMPSSDPTTTTETNVVTEKEKASDSHDDDDDDDHDHSGAETKVTWM